MFFNTEELIRHLPKPDAEADDYIKQKLAYDIAVCSIKGQKIKTITQYIVQEESK